MKLSLAEELLLLSLNDEKGSVLFAASTGLPFGLAGAVLMELAVQEKIKLEGKKILSAGDGDTGDAILDECLGLLRAAAKPKTIQHWISKLGGRKSIREGYLERLVQKFILRREEHKILWVFPATRFPASNPIEELEVRQRLRKAAFAEALPDLPTLLLISLVQACGLVGDVFPDRDERKQAKKRFAALAKEEVYGKAVADQIAAVMAACIAACSAATIAATAAHH